MENLDKEVTQLTAETAAKTTAIKFAEYCSHEGWHFRKGIGNWNCIYKDKNMTTEQLFNLYTQSPEFKNNQK